MLGVDLKTALKFIVDSVTRELKAFNASEGGGRLNTLYGQHAQVQAHTPSTAAVVYVAFHTVNNQQVDEQGKLWRLLYAGEVSSHSPKSNGQIRMSARAGQKVRRRGWGKGCGEEQAVWSNSQVHGKNLVINRFAADISAQEVQDCFGDVSWTP